jgi:hypothetical protein
LPRISLPSLIWTANSSACDRERIIHRRPSTVFNSRPRIATAAPYHSGLWEGTARYEMKLTSGPQDGG